MTASTVAANWEVYWRDQGILFPVLALFMTTAGRRLLLRKTYFGRIEGPSDGCDGNVFLRCLLTMSSLFQLFLCVSLCMCHEG